MQITNSHPNNRNINFQALPGGKIRAILINQPEKFQAIKEQLAPLGDPNTVVDIFSATKKFSNEKLYSLRLYNKVFGNSHNVPVDKNNIEYIPSKLIPKIEQLTNKDIEWREYSLFKEIKEFYSGKSFRYREYLDNIIKLSREQGIKLGSKAQKVFDSV